MDPWVFGKKENLEKITKTIDQIKKMRFDLTFPCRFIRWGRKEGRKKRSSECCDRVVVD